MNDSLITSTGHTATGYAEDRSILVVAFSAFAKWPFLREIAPLDDRRSWWIDDGLLLDVGKTEARRRRV